LWSADDNDIPEIWILLTGALGLAVLSGL